MPKPDPALLDPARYPFTCSVGTRLTDLDINLHVNNAALVYILQEARVRFYIDNELGTTFPQGMTWMAVNTTVDYLGQARHPEPVANFVGIVSLGRTSHTLGQLALQNHRPVAFAQTVFACTRDGNPTPNPPTFVEAAEKLKVRA